VQEFEVAEKFYLRANHPKECIEMYNKAGKWERAFKVLYYLLNFILDLFRILNRFPDCNFLS
jgi:hypothetical protein